MATNQSSSQRILIIAAVIIVALLAVNAFLLYNKYSQDRVISEKSTELDEANKLQIELEKQYQEALSELEEMRGSNTELNSMIDRQKEELRQQKERISELIRTGKELGKAQSEMQNLRVQVQGYLAENQRLKEENLQLLTAKQQLEERTQALSQTLDSANVRTATLEGEKASLSAEKEQLTSDKQVLESTVNLASVIKIQNVQVTPLKERSSGKTVKKKYAKNVDQLKICFQTTANEVARSGIERFFVRIISPLGETMAIDQLGSGVIVDKKTGEEMRYTHLAEYDYNNDQADVCFNWDPNLGNFQKGK
ncbi:MAG: hypothetical protein AAB316_09335, partial [Bacteroidota bacterium]